MPRGNPKNPHSSRKDEIEHEAPSGVLAATIDSVQSHDGRDQPYHTATVRIQGDPSPYQATVLAPSRGDVNVPTEGDDVAVAFGPSGQPYVIGYWYAADKVGDGRVNLPDYEPGERVIGTPHSKSSIKISKDGTITISTDGAKPVNIDHNSFTVYMGTDQDFPPDGDYHIVEFDTEEDDPENLFDPTTHTFTVKHSGRYEVSSTVEMADAGQNKIYQLAVFVNGTIEKRVSQQSALNSSISMHVEMNRDLDEGDEVDIRFSNGGSATRTIEGQSLTTDFSAERQGI